MDDEIKGLYIKIWSKLLPHNDKVSYKQFLIIYILILLSLKDLFTVCKVLFIFKNDVGLRF